MLNLVLNAKLGECGARMWNCMAFNLDDCLQPDSFAVSNVVPVPVVSKYSND